MISKICLFGLIMFAAATATNDTDFLGALDPHSFAEGNQPSNSNHGSRLLLVENNQTYKIDMYDGVSLVDVWQPGEKHLHLRKQA